MKIVKQILILVGIAIGIAGVMNLIHPKRIPWVGDWAHRVEAHAVQEKVPLVQLSEMIAFLRSGSHQFVDARSTEEYQRGHIPTALSIPFEAVEQGGAAEVLHSPRPLVLYCSGAACDDSLFLAIHLRDLGCESVSLFVGGMELWTSEGLTVEREDER